MKVVKNFFRKVVIKSLQALGYNFDEISLEGALERSKNHGIPIQTVIDIGASNGVWSERCQKYFPDAFYFLIEAQKPHAPALEKLKRRLPNVDYIMAAAGDGEGEIYFDASDLLGGIAAHTPFEKNCIIVPMTTVDVQVNLKNLQPPFLIKLDTHGFEVSILEGAVETLKQTELIVIEVYNFKISQDNLRFHEMCAYLEAKGFRCLDLCDPLRRPRDRALWQLDLFFARSTSPIFESDSYY